MSSLFSNKQQKKADQYSKTSAKASEQGEAFAHDVLSTLMPETLIASFKTISNKGHRHEKETIITIEENYHRGHPLSADELITLNDVYVAVTKRLENNEDRNNEQ